MDKNVMIPRSLLDRIVDLLQYWNITDYDLSVQQLYSDVLFELDNKKQTIELRESYTEIINAKTEDERHAARMKYLAQKSMLYPPF